MAVENARSRNDRYRLVCTPSTLDAALAYLGSEYCVPDVLYAEAERNKGMNFEAAVAGMGGEVWGKADAKQWFDLVDGLVGYTTKGEWTKKFGDWGKFISEDVFWYLRTQLRDLTVAKISDDIRWWLVCMLAGWIARENGRFCAMEWIKTSDHAHILLLALGHPGYGRSNDLLVWNRWPVDGFGWRKTLASEMGVAHVREVAGLPGMLFGENKDFDSIWLIFFELDKNSARVVRKRKEDQYEKGKAPQSRL